MSVQLDIGEAFSAAVALADRFSVYVPNQDRDGNAVEQAFWIDRCLRLLSEISGGATAMPPLRGAWLNPTTDALVVEEPVIVYSFIKPEEFARRIRDVVDLVNEIGRATNQGQMAIAFNQTLFLIDC